MTKSYNCANQIGPGTDPDAFNSSGTTLLGPSTAQGSIYNGVGLFGARSDGLFTLTKKATFGFDSTSDSFIPDPYTLTNNISVVTASGLTLILPVSPTVGDTYRIVGANSSTVIQMGGGNQFAYLVNVQTSSGGTITGTSTDQTITIVCVFVGAFIEYVCYDVQGTWILA